MVRIADSHVQGMPTPYLDDIGELGRSGATVGRVELETGIVHRVVRRRKVHGAGQLHERDQSRADARGAFSSEEDLDPFSRAFLVGWGGVELGA